MISPGKILGHLFRLPLCKVPFFFLKCLPSFSLNCSRETYNALTTWLSDARMLASQNIVIILCGNKKDLDADREVTFLEASRFAQENGRLRTLWSKGHALTDPVTNSNNSQGTSISEIVTVCFCSVKMMLLKVIVLCVCVRADVSGDQRSNRGKRRRGLCPVCSENP